MNPNPAAGSMRATYAREALAQCGPDATFTPSDCFGWLKLHTDRAREWFAANVPTEPWRDDGERGYCVERNEVAEIRAAMREDGLVVKS